MVFNILWNVITVFLNSLNPIICIIWKLMSMVVQEVVGWINRWLETIFRQIVCRIIEGLWYSETLNNYEQWNKWLEEQIYDTILAWDDLKMWTGVYNGVYFAVNKWWNGWLFFSRHESADADFFFHFCFLGDLLTCAPMCCKKHFAYYSGKLYHTHI